MPLKITNELKEEYFSSLEDIHNTIPDTKCKRNNICCNAGCPPMYFVEFLVILNEFKESVEKESLQDVAVNCMYNYFSSEVIKPCPLFVNGGCLIYDARPVNCRLYGQIPEEEYEKRQQRPSDELTMSAEEMKDALDLENIEDVPLYHQCPNVVPVPDTGQEITVESYGNIFRILGEIEGDFLDEIEIKIDLTSYKTFHDHYLWFTLGEALLERWTVLKQHLSNDPILLNDLLGKMEDEIKKHPKVVSVEF